MCISTLSPPPRPPKNSRPWLKEFISNKRNGPKEFISTLSTQPSLPLAPRLPATRWTPGRGSRILSPIKIIGHVLHAKTIASQIASRLHPRSAEPGTRTLGPGALSRSQEREAGSLVVRIFVLADGLIRPRLVHSEFRAEVPRDSSVCAGRHVACAFELIPLENLSGHCRTFWGLSEVRT